MNALPLKTKTKCFLKTTMYSPFLWWNAKGQSKPIIKRRWRWRTLKSCQIHSQTTNLIKNVHQNLSLSRLNGQDMIQRTSNVWIIWSSRWRNISSSGSSTRRLRSISTYRRGMRGNNTKRCTSRTRRINSQVSSPLCKEGSVRISALKSYCMMLCMLLCMT